jgi:mRNA interferase RelE/StbE
MATWKIEVSPLADRQLDKLDSQIARRIEKFLHERVAMLEDPRSIGEALRGSRLGEFWKYRVGDWRIICDIQDEKLIILALQIGHRREVYER